MDRNLTLEEYAEYSKYTVEDLIKGLIDEKGYYNNVAISLADTRHELEMYRNAVSRHGVNVDCNLDSPHLAHHNKTSK